MLQSAAQSVAYRAAKPLSRRAAIEVHLHLVEEVLGRVAPRQVLSAAEWDHARQITHADAWRAYVAGRCLLRQALSQEVNGATAPADWRLTEGPHGKPRLATAQPALSFNLSHAGDAVALAVSRYEVGIDLEICNPATTPLAESLCARELACLEATPAEDVADAFLAMWCAKEAAAKALGLGAMLDFHQLEVDPAQGEVYLSGEIAGPPPRIRFRSVSARLSGRAYCLAVALLQ